MLAIGEHILMNSIENLGTMVNYVSGQHVKFGNCGGKGVQFIKTPYLLVELAAENRNVPESADNLVIQDAITPALPATGQTCPCLPGHAFRYLIPFCL
jgi:hypothetical protein